MITYSHSFKPCALPHRWNMNTHPTTTRNTLNPPDKAPPAPPFKGGYQQVRSVRTTSGHPPAPHTTVCDQRGYTSQVIGHPYHPARHQIGVRRRALWNLKNKNLIHHAIEFSNIICTHQHSHTQSVLVAVTDFRVYPQSY